MTVCPLQGLKYLLSDPLQKGLACPVLDTILSDLPSNLVCFPESPFCPIITTYPVTLNLGGSITHILP